MIMCMPGFVRRSSCATMETQLKMRTEQAGLVHRAAASFTQSPHVCGSLCPPSRCLLLGHRTCVDSLRRVAAAQTSGRAGRAMLPEPLLSDRDVDGTAHGLQWTKKLIPFAAPQQA
ncbi:hypothetical protein EJ03DRAFT_36687 [Teratosphaeria nubilosa]|uniref:Uncharacterized protein n=1 Tax=Teratosphaeria nubilosa TaxID=161662 RepID=A0A6G1LE88_9PEZI|nr:hypothetical protein EJ03DRAFT_36687 [Teratosphaeria nubilosa]